MKYKVADRKSKAEKSRDPLPFLAGALFACLPMVFSPSGYDAFRVPKDIFLCLAVLLLAAVYVGVRGIKLRLPLSLWDQLLLVGVLFTAAHSLLSDRPLVAWTGVERILYFVVLLLIVSNITSPGFQRKAWLAAGLVISLNALFTVLQYFGKFGMMLRSADEVLRGRVTPAGFIGEVNSGGLLFALICLISLYGMIAERDLKLRLVWAGIVIFNVAGLVFTRTLTALISLAVALFLWVIFHHWWLLRSKKKVLRQVAVFWLLLVLGLAGGGILATRSGMVGRVSEVMRQMAEGNWTVATAGRQPVYLITWEMIRENPFLGRGLNTFGQDFYSRRADTTYGRSLFMINQPGAFREVHNEYLQVWAELGFLGLLCFLALLFLPLFEAFRRFRRCQDPQQAYWVMVLALGLVLVAVGSLTFFPFHLTVTAAYTVLLVACLRSFETRPSTRTLSLDQKLPLFGNVARLCAAGAVVLALLLGYGQAQKWGANSHMGVAAGLLEEAQSSTANQRLRHALADEALFRLQKAERLYPRFYEIYNLQGSALMLLGRHEEAQAAYSRAAIHLPSPELYTNLAVAHMAAGDSERARAYLESALSYNPRYKRARDALRYLDQ